MSNTTVVNKRKSDFDVYIGRGSPFGNPHPIGWCSLCKRTHDRADCLKEYRRDFALSVFPGSDSKAWRAAIFAFNEGDDRDSKFVADCLPYYASLH